jgi:hypothetical protein
MKSKIIILIALPAAIAMNALAQSGSNTIIKEPRTSAPYHHVHIKGEMNVRLVQNEVAGVTVEGTSYQTGNTVTMLRNDTLYVYQTNIRKTDSKTYVAINVDALVSLEVSGKTKVNCSGLVNTDYLTIKANAGAQIKLDVRALKVDSRATGCGFIDLSGSTASKVESKDKCSIIDSHLLDVLDTRKAANHFCPGC